MSGDPADMMIPPNIINYRKTNGHAAQGLRGNGPLISEVQGL